MCSAGGLMLKFSGLLCFLLLAVVSAAGEESFPARERGTEPFPFQERFQKEFRELFEMLAKEYPQFRNRLEEPDVDRALVAVMDSLGAGVSVERNASEQKGGDSASERKTRKMLPAVRLSNGIMYFRLDSIGKREIAELLKLLKAEEKGLILDLRSCSSGNGEELSRSLSRFLEESGTSGGAHTAILTGPATEGASEILASMLTAARRGIRIGEPTAGRPYPRKKVMVSGRKWLVPVPPEGAGNVRYTRFLPQIAIPAEPQESYEKVCAEEFTASGDRCLSRAADLLVSLDLLDKKGLKK